ncbi:GNAT family N-acetyltransferase [Rossellomorea aquimaris]|jgi:GNAT superfamily N-acetyltransferase|uniref:GNAT family N-acetyltransferase n=1 Tax=Rossellomorea aquimaris TaxID=189382 RepID=A0A1J6VTG9_9BACI|nr:GNAT family N-acetyltransferase [Rossellomorea aquimaris]OIU68554.1 GNAT family N-acetyltransferase [Rossellomorea aquimaris]
MYRTRNATEAEFPVLADHWYRMACEMSEIDGVPKPDIHRIEEVKCLFLRESEAGQLMFRVAVDESDQIAACAGGLVRTEYPYPLAEEQSIFGWVISVYTLENHRHNGLASTLTDEVCEWLKQKGARRARLWSSSSGRSVYEKSGFKPMMDMTKPLL